MAILSRPAGRTTEEREVVVTGGIGTVLETITIWQRLQVCCLAGLEVLGMLRKHHS
jgi:hypothetical protein